MRAIKFALCGICLTLLCSPLWAQNARQQLEVFTTDLATLSGQFNQNVYAKDGAVSEETSGQIMLKKPGRFRWDYQGEFPQQIIADGQKIWIYDIELEQITVKPQSTVLSDSPLAILEDVSKLDEQFTVSEAGLENDVSMLLLTPRSSDAEFARIILGLSGNRLRSMSMEDSFGQRTEIQFSELRCNLELADDLFAFTPPTGVDVIGETD